MLGHEVGPVAERVIAIGPLTGAGCAAMNSNSFFHLLQMLPLSKITMSSLEGSYAKCQCSVSYYGREMGAAAMEDLKIVCSIFNLLVILTTKKTYQQSANKRLADDLLHNSGLNLGHVVGSADRCD